ncbi:MAG TPA: arginase [bacterium]|nr:arginase [bacterium]
MPPPVELIGAPLDWGASRRGCRLGPDALRALYLIPMAQDLGREMFDGGNVQLPPLPSGALPSSPPGSPPALNHEHAVVATCDGLAERVESAMVAGRFPLVVGGDHSIAMGTLGGVARVVKNLGLIWVDAHADFNDSTTSPSGNIHGMPLAAIVGQSDAVLNNIAGINPKVRPGRTVLLGVRDIDLLELPKLHSSGVTVFTSWEVERRGIQAVVADALEVAGEGTDGVHLSFDLDSLNPLEMPGTGTTAAGGLTFREASVLVNQLQGSGRLVSCEVTELNPLLDMAGTSCRQARDLILYVLGKPLF